MPQPHNRARPVPQAHPVIHLLDMQMRTQQMSVYELARITGISRRTLCDWWHGADPRLSLVEAALNVFDLTLKGKPR